MSTYCFVNPIKWTRESWDEVCGYHDDEHWIVDAIKAHLLTPQQRQWLFEHDLSVEDLLNGRYGGDLEEEIYKIYDDWNKKLGFKEFGDASEF